jgi:3-phenylpropionate/trans-cinnamate dioxygenase ferredoxin subunit
MGTKKYKWFKVAGAAAELQLTAGGVAEVEVDGKKMCVGRFDGSWYGFAHACPHAGAPMTDAYLTGACQVVCPVHSLKFDLKNGRDINGGGYVLKMHPVEVREDGVYFGIEEKSGGLFGLFR